MPDSRLQQKLHDGAAACLFKAEETALHTTHISARAYELQEIALNTQN